MNKSALNAIWNMTRQKYGIYLRVLEALPEDKIHEHVVPNMRTPAEIVAHTSGGIVREIAKGVASGEIKNAPSDSDLAAEMKTKDDMLAFARECWEEADAAVASIGDNELSRIVKTPWGIEFPGGVGIHTLNDEFMHHRGQLYVYARACGVEPPFLWSFDKNPEGFTGPAA
jgi:uncharacterized damage-inducible protein DinB